MIDGQIGTLSFKNDTVVIGSSQGIIAHYPITNTSVQPEDPSLVEYQNVESAIVAVSMDELNNEGLIGTESGCIHYVNFAEKIVIKLVSGNNNNQDTINFCKFDPVNSNIVVSSCGQKSDEFKINTVQNCDQVMNF